MKLKPIFRRRTKHTTTHKTTTARPPLLRRPITRIKKHIMNRALTFALNWIRDRAAGIKTTLLGVTALLIALANLIRWAITAEAPTFEEASAFIAIIAAAWASIFAAENPTENTITITTSDHAPQHTPPIPLYPGDHADGLTSPPIDHASAIFPTDPPAHPFAEQAGPPKPKPPLGRPGHILPVLLAFIALPLALIAWGQAIWTGQALPMIIAGAILLLSGIVLVRRPA